MEKKERKEYCQSCNDYVEFDVKKVSKTIQVKEETVIVDVYECYCKECGERIFVYDYEKMNDIIVYDAYKKKVGLLTSSEIKDLRRKRGMTQIELARFLGIGDKDITRYESGSIQNKCIDNLLRLVKDDKSYEEMVRVFRGETASTWIDFKAIFWDINKLFIAEGFGGEGLWSPYRKVINEFDCYREGVVRDNARERREEVPVA